MPHQKLCLGTNSQFHADIIEQISMIREAGFHEIFFDWKKDAPVDLWCKIARDCGLPIQSIHGPFGGCRALWEDDEAAANAALTDLVCCLHLCADQQIPIMISHVFIGFDIPPISKEKGLNRYGKLIREAQKCGVTIAFENTEGEEYLDAVLQTFGNEKHVGFCWDSGHEMCYNRSEDLLARYGQFLAATHINDNLGIKDINGRITWHDDLHLLPFDGIADWDYDAKRLVNTGFSGTLTFELNTISKPDRHENDLYDAMPLDAYLAEAYKRACKVENLVFKRLNFSHGYDKM